ncbi:hypothetical protein RIF29_06672 [Crotalaria pallida]|uniref:Ubiquitin-like domain-containing protein n=1 Tax=Crotalaria pallida TaxID=3830 RepID=A0AAN9J3E7_CROPI
MKIVVKTLITVDVDPTDTIDQVKAKIQETELTTPLYHQLLTFQGRQTEESKTLTDYKINHDSTLLRLFIPGGTGMQIFVKSLSGKTITVEVDRSETIGEVKAKIEAKTRVPVKKQCLSWCGKTLRDEFAVSYYNIFKESTLHLSVIFPCCSRS